MTPLKTKDGKINFKCKAEHCKHSCCGPFAGISKELCSIDQRPFDEIVLTDDDHRLIYENGGAELIEEGYSHVAKKAYFKMALEDDGTCKAWKDGHCTIHDYSPTLCQAFPFYFDMFAGLCTIQCEGFSDDEWSDLEQYQGYIRKAKEMYEFWIDFYSGV